MKYILMLTLLLMASCSNDPAGLDGQYVKDANGNIYLINAHAGDAYFIHIYKAPSSSTGLEVLLNEESK
jgi:hypothetical protein